MYQSNVGGLQCCNCKRLFGAYYCSSPIKYVTEDDSKSGFREFYVQDKSVKIFCSDKCRSEWLFAHYEDLQD